MGIAREMHGIVNDITESATWSSFCCRGFFESNAGHVLLLAFLFFWNLRLVNDRITPRCGAIGV